MAKYIENKKIDVNKSNDVPELEGVDKAAWKLLSAIYNLGWDPLFADKNKNSFKQKVLFKYTPRVNLVNTRKKGEKNKDKLAIIERLLPPIPAKSPKEVKEILKYFKMIDPSKLNTNNEKSYT